MDDNKINSNDIKWVNMNEVAISTPEKTIIGTLGLATCVGVLLYNENEKKAVVGHVSSNWEPMTKELVTVAIQNGLDTSEIKYLIIPGFYEEHYNVKKGLEMFFSELKPLMKPFSENEITNESILNDKELPSRYFAFDAATGKFVTNKINLEVINLEEESNGRK